MRMVEISAATWKQLLELKRNPSIAPLPITDPAFAIYAPLVSGRARFILAQVGQSLDGRVATCAGDARDISGGDGLAHLHRSRALMDAVIVGATTVIADDPRLSVRLVTGSDPVRVVIDFYAELTGEEQLFHDQGAPVIVFRTPEAEGKPLPNAEVVNLERCRAGFAPAAIVRVLAERDLHRLLIEGGARTIARFIEARLVDRLHVTISPLIIGSGPAGISLSPIEQLTQAYRPPTDVYSLGSDILFDCRFADMEGSTQRSESLPIAAGKSGAVEASVKKRGRQLQICGSITAQE